MTKYEKLCIEWVGKNIFKLLCIVFFLLSLFIRYEGRNFLSVDAECYLLPWMEAIHNHGGIFGGLSQQVGNYNLIYQIIIAIMSYIPIEPLYKYKLLSVFFDYCLAVGIMLIVNELLQNIPIQARKWNVLVAGLFVLFSPVVCWNSAFWAQCDAIYTTFTVFGIYFLLKEKYHRAFIMFGLAFSFKLQACFIWPALLIIWFVKRKFSIFYFLWIPITLFLSGIPCYMQGRNVLDCLKVYLLQAGEYKYLWLGYPSFWALSVPANYYDALVGMAIATTIVALGVIFCYILKEKITFNDHRKIVLVAFYTVYSIVLFLPAMHERYGFMYEILAIPVIFCNKKTLPCMLALHALSMCTYSVYLYYAVFSWNVLAAINLLIYVVYGYLLFKQLKEL